MAVCMCMCAPHTCLDVIWAAGTATAPRECLPPSHRAAHTARRRLCMTAARTLPGQPPAPACFGDRKQEGRMSKIAVADLISWSKLSAKNEGPSMADKKMDSTWLKRSS